jgi:hypothetical protein
VSVIPGDLYKQRRKFVGASGDSPKIVSALLPFLMPPFVLTSFLIASFAV